MHNGPFAAVMLPPPNSSQASRLAGGILLEILLFFSFLPSIFLCPCHARCCLDKLYEAEDSLRNTMQLF